MARLASGLLVNALVRRVNAAGGSAIVLARGDADGGAILIVGLERGANPALYERGLGPDGEAMLVRSGPTDIDDPAQADAYWQRRRVRDPDLWVVELDIAGAERFAAETLIGR